MLCIYSPPEDHPGLRHSYPCPCPRQFVERTCITKQYRQGYGYE